MQIFCTLLINKEKNLFFLCDNVVIIQHRIIHPLILPVKGYKILINKNLR